MLISWFSISFVFFKVGHHPSAKQFHPGQDVWHYVCGDWAAVGQSKSILTASERLTREIYTEALVFQGKESTADIIPAAEPLILKCVRLTHGAWKHVVLFPTSLSADCGEWQNGRVHQRPGHGFPQRCPHAHAAETQRHPAGVSSRFSARNSNF